jgi:hypothetical protein
MNQTERLWNLDNFLSANRCVPVRGFLEEIGNFKRDLEPQRSHLYAIR